MPSCDDKFATYSEDFIKKMADSDQPFFLYHCTRGAHVKNYPNPKFKGKSPAKYPYKDCIVEMDDILGRLVKTLEETGQLENTLIFVTSDNGPMIEPWPDAGYTPFRGGIGTHLGRRHACPRHRLLEGHDRRQARQVTGCSTLPTCSSPPLALAGVEYRPPEDQYLDSIDQTSFLLADAGLSNRKYVYYWLQDRLQRRSAWLSTSSCWPACRTTNRTWSIPASRRPCWRTTRTPKLYNLYLDPKERYSFFDRQTFMDNLFSDPLYAHTDTFQKYPGKKAMIQAKIEDFLNSK